MAQTVADSHAGKCAPASHYPQKTKETGSRSKPPVAAVLEVHHDVTGLPYAEAVTSRP